MTDLANLETLKREVAAITWWHTIDLGKGIVTPGLDPTPARLPEIRLPEDLAAAERSGCGRVGWVLLVRSRASRGKACAGHRFILLGTGWLGHEGWL